MVIHSGCDPGMLEESCWVLSERQNAVLGLHPFRITTVKRDLDFLRHPLPGSLEHLPFHREASVSPTIENSRN